MQRIETGHWDAFFSFKRSTRYPRDGQSVRQDLTSCVRLLDHTSGLAVAVALQTALVTIVLVLFAPPGGDDRSTVQTRYFYLGSRDLGNATRARRSRCNAAPRSFRLLSSASDARSSVELNGWQKRRAGISLFAGVVSKVRVCGSAWCGEDEANPADRRRRQPSRRSRRQ
jgi:hypothetical protein